MKYWLLKSEPEEYSWLQMSCDKEACWDGVKNHQAISNMKGMGVGDLAFFYHSGKLRGVFGVVRIRRGFYFHDKFGGVVDVSFYSELRRSVSLKEIKDCVALRGMVMLKQPRLSVVQISEEEWLEIMRISNTAR